jgi:SAM-dependent methyltransferase
VTAPDRWSGGDAYEAYIGRWSRLVGVAFVDWLDIAARSSWVDVGCGTGALSATILARSDPTSVRGIDPSADFIQHAAAHIDDPRVSFALGTADALPLDGGEADVVVAGLVLNFVPDPAAALAEMRRVARTGGVIAVYVWDYADRMDLLRRLFDAAVALDPSAEAVDERTRFPLCSPGPLRALFEDSGLDAVEVRSIDVPTVFASFDDYWTPFLSGVGPAPGYVAGLDDRARAALRDRLRAMLPIATDGSIDLIARAWAVRGRA